MEIGALGAAGAPLQPQHCGSQAQCAELIEAVQKGWQPQVLSPSHHGVHEPCGKEPQ